MPAHFRIDYGQVKLSPRSEGLPPLATMAAAKVDPLTDQNGITESSKRRFSARSLARAQIDQIHTLGAYSTTAPDDGQWEGLIYYFAVHQ